jgi:phosphoribosylformylglycinamidine synthase
MDAKAPGDWVYVLGLTYAELGGSEWYALNGAIGNQCPQVDTARAKRLYRALSGAIRAGWVASCHDCSDGGLGVALAEVCFAGGWGMSVDLRQVPHAGLRRNDELLFSESQSRFVVTVRPEAKDAFEKRLKQSVCAQVGIVTAQPVLEITGLQGQPLLRESLAELKAAWQRPLHF